MKENFIQPTIFISPQIPVNIILPYFDFSKYFWAFKLKKILFIVACSNANKNCSVRCPQAASENLTFSQDLIQTQ